MMTDRFLFTITIMTNHQVPELSFLCSHPSFFYFLAVLPRKTERIQQWLSTCETKEEVVIPENTSPKTQYKMRCIAKAIRHPSPSSQHYPENNLSPPIRQEPEPGRFRSCLKIHLETIQTTDHRSRASSSTTKYPERHQTISHEDLCITDDEYYQHDHQAVFL